MSALRDLVEKHYEQINTNDFSNSLELFSPNVESRVPGGGAMRGIEPFIAYGQAFHQGFPDGRIHLESAVEAGDTIIVEGRFTGTQSGPLAGPAGTIPPTGKPLDLAFCDVFRVKDGRIVAHRIYYDQVDFLSQLGLMPAPASA